ncbi:MAG: TIGR03986 family CRISPR-associated RAMP protein [Patulibacter sp.]
MPQFLNPYTFVPFAPEPKGQLGRGAPPGHDEYLPDRYHGRLEVKLTAKTPLVLFDEASYNQKLRDGTEHGSEHGSFACPTTPDGRPLLSATTVRGAIRAQYTALTGSRLTTFPEQQPLTVREQPQPGQAGDPFEPIRVSRDEDGKLVYQRLRDQYLGDDEHLAAVPFNPSRHRPWKSSARMVGINNPLTVDDHGAHVVAAVVWCSWKRGRQDRTFYRVVSLARISEAATPDDLARACRSVQADSERARLAEQPDGGNVPIWGDTTVSDPTDPGLVRALVRGRMRISGRTASNKHDEQLFILERCAHGEVLTGKDEFEKVPLPPIAEVQWTQIASDHERGLGSGEPDAGIVRGQWAWPGRTLEEQQLVWALFDDNDEIQEVVPTAYAPRRIQRPAPAEALPDHVRPMVASLSRSDCSSADRVFGYVVQQRGARDAAYRSHLRFSPVSCHDTSGHWKVDWGDPGLPLAILSSPKPTLKAFYGPTTGPRGLKLPGVKRYWQRSGESRMPPLPGPAPDNPTAVDGQHLVGRAHAPGPGQAPRADNVVYGSLMPGGLRTKQNRSVRSWVRTGTAFTFSIDFDNLTAAELGALLWVLGTRSRNAEHSPAARLALGGAVPLGYGNASVEVKLDVSHIERGDHRAARYRARTPGENDSPHQHAQASLVALESALLEAARDAGSAPEAMNALPHVQALHAVERASFGSPRGPLPVLYPRPRYANPGAVGNEGYRWYRPLPDAHSISAVPPGTVPNDGIDELQPPVRTPPLLEMGA